MWRSERGNHLDPQPFQVISAVHEHRREPFEAALAERQDLGLVDREEGGDPVAVPAWSEVLSGSPLLASAVPHDLHHRGGCGDRERRLGGQAEPWVAP